MNRNTIFKLIDRIFGYHADKLKIILNVLCHDWRMIPPVYFNDPAFHSISEAEIRKNFDGMDEESVLQTIRYIRAENIFSIPTGHLGAFFYNFQHVMTAEELKLRKKVFRKWHSDKVKQTCFPSAGPESVIYRHGLPFFPKTALGSLRGGVMIDAGAYQGDSTYAVLRSYPFKRSLAFEPIHGNLEQLKKNMKSLLIGEDRYLPVQAGLSDKDGSAVFSRQEDSSRLDAMTEDQEGETISLVTLDSFVKREHVKAIRFIKSDLEGMGTEMLRGAEQTIRQNRPLLSLCIYHTKEELFDTLNILKSWDLNYEFKIQMMSYPIQLGELTLLGYPKELNKDQKTAWRSFDEVISECLKN